jgi:hypothetical protein
MMHVAVVVAMLGIVVVLTVVSVGVVVHLVHPLHFTRAGYVALTFWANFAVIQTDGSTVLLAAHRVAGTAKHAQAGLPVPPRAIRQGRLLSGKFDTSEARIH